MPNLMHLLSGGHYARKQLLGNVGLMSWSHKRRFQIALELARQFQGKRILDYGCGDGTFLAMLMSEPSAPAEAVGAELYEEDVNECANRLGRIAGLKFTMIDRLPKQDQFDAIYCMEVLEHTVNVPAVLHRMNDLLAPRGKLLISVPVETGLPLLLKQVARHVAAMRGMKDYPGSEPYTLREFAASIFAGSRQHIVRPVYPGKNGVRFHDHKGFNWMALRKVIGDSFVIEKLLLSPVCWLPAHLASQVWFELRKKEPA
jgi:SAM-dependent methyltransferase